MDDQISEHNSLKGILLVDKGSVVHRINVYNILNINAYLKIVLKRKNNPSVLVTDARIGACLSIVRSLGKRGINVYCGTDKNALEGKYDSGKLNAISSYSKFTKQTFYYTDPSNQKELENSIANITQLKKIKVLIPVAQRSTEALSKAKKKLKHPIIPIADYESMRIALSKKETIKLAGRLEIPAPKTIIINHFSDLRNLKLKFPLVVKGVTGSGVVDYVHDIQGLEKSVSTIKQLQGQYPLIQEYIKGSGYGFFALFNKGEPHAIFMHKRIKEYPATGGMSTSAESVYEPKMMNYGLKLLRKLCWHGVAMVEFKRDIHDNEFKLMEINPRFWGSLDLSIAAGVDFPYLLYKMAIEGDVEQVFNYKRGLRYTWVPNDLVRTFQDRAFRIRVKSFLRDSIDPRIKTNMNRNDPKPSLMQLLTAVNRII